MDSKDRKETFILHVENLKNWGLKEWCGIFLKPDMEKESQMQFEEL
jgi:hypothetical protein